MWYIPIAWAAGGNAGKLEPVTFTDRKKDVKSSADWKGKMAKTSLSIPKRYRSALVRLLTFAPAELVTFVDSLLQAQPTASIHELSLQLTMKNPEIDSEDLHDILEMLVGLYRVHIDLGRSSQKSLVNDFVSAARQEAEQSDIVVRTPWAKLRASLQSLFKDDGPLGITAKAADLSAENERRFCPASRILTDVRPVFSASVSAAPVAAIIQHTLKLTYHVSQGKTEELYVALTNDNIDYLLYLLMRSKEKERTLRGFLRRTGVVLMEADEAEHD